MCYLITVNIMHHYKSKKEIQNGIVWFHALYNLYDVFHNYYQLKTGWVMKVPA